MNHLKIAKICLVLFIILTVYLLLGCSRAVSIEKANRDVARYMNKPYRPLDY